VTVKSTGKRPSASGKARPARQRARDKPKVIDRILDFPYRKLFGLSGQLTIASFVLVILVVKFVTGINTVTLDPMTCELAWVDTVYKPFHKQRILANTQSELTKLMAEKQTALWQINAGRNPFPSTGNGNVAGAKRINKDKFFWRSYAVNLEKERVAISTCLRRLPTYSFD